RAVRETAGIIDLTSFGKIDVEGPGALGLLQRVSANDVDKPVGTIVYTPWCDERGGMVADVTITRLAADRFRVVTGAGFVAGDLAWLQWSRVDGEDVGIRDISDELATIGLWGPRSRTILSAATQDAVDDVAIPLRRALGVAIAGAPVLAARISYAGEFGWELTTDRSRAVTVWDALRRAGADHGLEPFGYRALDALRMEKGYRYYSVDMTMLDTPFEAGLGSFVRLGKGPFSGREALRAAADREGPARRLGTVLVGGLGDPPVYGGEAVRSDGRVIGRLRSIAFGPTVGRTIGYVYRPADLAEDAPVTVDAFDQRVPASWAPDVLVDPAGERMRG
ncbi:MAG TPA: aminomethyltransferase family protein, partial [Verrucomicrobiae bacterium]|nr:aminomethyltransferase family protein [Verrucomicrobiae bacterium]